LSLLDQDFYGVSSLISYNLDMCADELLPTIQALPKSERLRLMRLILQTLELEEKTSEQPYQKLLGLAGFIKDPVTRHARENAEDEISRASSQIGGNSA
jgi:hypothetical protein